MNSSARVLSMFLFSALIFVAALYVLFGLDMPQWQNVQTSRYQVAERQAVRDHLMDLINQFRQEVAQFTNLDAQITLISNTLPDSMNIPELLATIETMTGNNHVSLDQITFTSVSANQTPTIAPATAPGAPIAPAKTMTVTVSISGSGDYSSVKDFLNSLETEQRLIDVSTFSLSPLPTTGSKTPSFAFRLDAKAYYITPPQFTLP